MPDLFEQIEINEKIFSANNYDAYGDENYKIIEGTIPVMLSAPHAANHFRNGQKKWADLYTGGIALYLQQITGCHLIYNACFTEKDPNFDAPKSNNYQIKLKNYIKKMEQNGQPICVLLDLHGSATTREYAVELGTAPNPSLTEIEKNADLTSLHGHKFVEDIVINSFKEHFYELNTVKKSVWKNKIFSAGGTNTVTKNISDSTKTDCLQLEINGEYRNPCNKEQFSALIASLIKIVEKLAAIDWKKIK
ncbi:MAG: hypothetical protein IJ099_05710 [Alphaproteobacteria bacterium]|nr:hypothetical protein [Alphaproteobacteria bacterium]